MKIKHMFAAMLLTVAAGPAMAEVIDLGELDVPSITEFGNTFTSAGTHSDAVEFSISEAAAAGGLVLEIDFNRTLNVNITSIVFSGPSFSTVSILGLAQVLNMGVLAVGDYVLQIQSTVTASYPVTGNVGYSGLLALVRAPGNSVPEPGTLALLGVGLVGIALSARRRKARA